MSTVKYGQFDGTSLCIKTTPAEGAKKLFGEVSPSSSPADHSNDVTSTKIRDVFNSVDFSAMRVPANAKFDADAGETLGVALASSTVDKLSLRDCGGNTALVGGTNLCKVVAPVLKESFNLLQLDLSNCNVSKETAKELAAAIAGCSLQEFCIANNPIGGEGAKFLAASISRSKCQRVSLQRCNIETSADVVAVITSLGRSSTMCAIDLRGNPGLDAAALGALRGIEPTLQRNAAALFPRSTVLLAEFTTELPPSEAGAAEVDGIGGADGAACDETESQIAQREQEGGAADHNSSSQARAKQKPMTKEEFEYSLRRWRRKDPIPTGGRKESLTPSSVGRAPSPVVRRNLSLEEAPIKQDAMTRDVLKGAQEWKEIRNQYNQFIHSPARAPDLDVRLSEMRQRALSKPTFVLGKRVEQAYRATTPQFRGKPAAVRTASPKVIQQHAPWLNKPSLAAGATSLPEGYVPPAVGSRTTVVVGYTGSGMPIYASIVDGGEQTYIDPRNDRRDVGYYAKKVKEGEIKPQEPWRRSHSQREVRFGVGDASDKKGTVLLKEAQAPDPGTYTPEDEWEKTARKLRERAKLRERSATGQKLFGSAAPRLGGPVRKDFDTPAMGDYEIP